MQKMPFNKRGSLMISVTVSNTEIPSLEEDQAENVIWSSVYRRRLDYFWVGEACMFKMFNRKRSSPRNTKLHFT